MKFDAFIHFNGNCKKAVDFYMKVFGVKKPSYSMTYGELPDADVSKKDKNRISYTSLKIGANYVMFSDSPSSMQHIQGNNITLVISCKTVAETKKIFDAMKAGGKVNMPLQKTFWAKSFGMLTDKFGINWIFSCENGSSKK